MSCCQNTVKELINNCCSDDCGDETTCAPLFDIASPVDGQLLVYSDEFQSFINKNPDNIVLKPQTYTPINRVDGIMFVSNGNLCIQLNGILYKVSVTPL
jgi:hypothetical protein